MRRPPWEDDPYRDERPREPDPGPGLPPGVDLPDEGDTLSIERTVGETRDGGSCAECGGEYRGAPYDESRGVRVLAEVEPGLTEPVNLCSECYRDAQEVDQA